MRGCFRGIADIYFADIRNPDTDRMRLGPVMGSILNTNILNSFKKYFCSVLYLYLKYFDKLAVKYLYSVPLTIKTLAEKISHPTRVFGRT